MPGNETRSEMLLRLSAQQNLPESQRKVDCAARIEECFYVHRRRYGSRRIAAELQIGRFRARAAMKRMGLRAIALKRSTPKTTDLKHGLTGLR